MLLSDVQGYPARANTVRANRVTANGTDLVLATGTPAGNCFTGNGESLTSPARLPRETRCAKGTRGAVRAEPDTGLVRDPLGHPTPVQAPPGLSFQDVPAPPSQRSMPHAGTTPPHPAVGLPGKVNPGKFLLPDADQDQGRGELRDQPQLTRSRHTTLTAPPMARPEEQPPAPEPHPDPS